MSDERRCGAEHPVTMTYGSNVYFSNGAVEFLGPKIPQLLRAARPDGLLDLRNFTAPKTKTWELETGTLLMQGNQFPMSMGKGFSLKIQASCF